MRIASCASCVCPLEAGAGELGLMGDGGPFDALRGCEAEGDDRRGELDLHGSLVGLRGTEALAGQDARGDQVVAEAGELGDRAAADGARLDVRSWLCSDRGGGA